MTNHTTPAALAHRDGATPDEAALIPPDAQLQPIPLRWGLNDVMWGDDDTVTVMLSGPDGEPYWLELDPERAAVLREDLAGPDGERDDQADADRAALRDRIADVVQQVPGTYTLPRPLAEADATAVLAVLPAPAGQAEAVLRVVETALGDTLVDSARDEALAGITAVLHTSAPADQTAVTPPPALTEEGRLRSRVRVLEEEVERCKGLAKVGARCMREGHQGQIESGRVVLEGHRFALSTKLGLGTDAPWDAIHERVKTLFEPAVRDALRRADEAEARAAAMERAMESTATDALRHQGCHQKLMAQCQRAERAEAELRRMADETPAAAETQQSGGAA